MTKLQFNSIVPNDIYYNNQSVNKVFYVDPNGVQTEVWPLTPTVSVGTTLIEVECLARTSDDNLKDSVYGKIRLYFYKNGTLTPTASVDGGGPDQESTRTTLPHPVPEGGFKWISTAASDQDFSTPTSYQFKVSERIEDDETNSGSLSPPGSPVSGKHLESGEDFISFDSGTGYSQSYLVFELEGPTAFGAAIDKYEFTIKDPDGNESSFTIKFTIEVEA